MKEKAKSAAITPGQVSHIWALTRKELGFDSEWLYGFLETNFGVERLHELDASTANRAIDALRRLCGKERSSWRITAAQIGAIGHRLAELHITDSGARKLCARVSRGRVEEWRWLGWQEARGLIALLEKLRQANAARSSGGHGLNAREESGEKIKPRNTQKARKEKEHTTERGSEDRMSAGVG